ncbi:hypothetical protein [Hymenobacter sp. YC55]|uniref:hypothetical protein n=1 Tax=Hymenobacter sp. YC55 TaxID=3034019 RepID=UPI0023F89F9B|nr:hypothetical protein [Hymenobacter sp. YC55]MDF7812721.1 hypothetical protein [Hymenobacter sp. YC55]
MKNLLPSLLPALALLTLGGCAGTSALSTTENDGVYYSSQDRTTQNATASVANTAPATEAESGDEISNPDYAADGRQSSTVTESTEYYDDDYAYSSRIRRFHQPYYRGFGYGYNDFVYADPFWYGGSPYYGSAFYDPFYSPYGYGYGGLGSYVNINIGFGRPWGWGYNPWRYGRGYSLFDNYYGYGYGGGYGYGYGGYGGYNNYYNVNNYYGTGVGSSRNVRYGARNGRSAEAGTAGRTSVGTGNVTGSRSRAISEGGVAAPTGGRSSMGGVPDNGGTVQPSGRGRSRSADAGTLGGVPSEVTTGGRSAGTTTDPQVTGRAGRYNQSVNTNEQINNGGTIAQPSYESRGRRRATEAIGNVNDGSIQQSTQPQYSQPRRTRFSELNTNQSSGGQTAEQPVRRQRTYEAPQQTYQQPTRTYEAPQRSYSEPSRSSSSFPSSGGGSNSGGGNSGGGGGGRGRGRD